LERYKAIWGNDYSSTEKDMTVIEVRTGQFYPSASAAYLPFYTSIVADLVKVICGDTRLELCSGDVQYFSS
jgi:hypothetical protein